MAEAAKKNLVMICGEAISGKSGSLMNLPNPEKVLYLNCEGKELPFPAKFKQVNIYDPYKLFQLFERAADNGYEKIIVESQTFLMDMFVSVHIHGAADGRAGWGNYAQFFRNLMLQYVPKFPGDVIFTAHQEVVYDETNKKMVTKIPAQGALGKKMIEAFYTIMVTTKVKLLEDLEEYENDLLIITADDKAQGYKHVFQTRPTVDTINEKGVRAPIGMWAIKETYIDNDAGKLMTRIKEYYGN